MKLKICLFAFIFISLFNCKYKVSIEQKVSIDSYSDNTRYVETSVWVRKWYGRPVSLEYYQYESKVNPSNVDSLLLLGMKEAKIIKQKAEKLINNN